MNHSIISWIMYSSKRGTEILSQKLSMPKLVSKNLSWLCPGAAGLTFQENNNLREEYFDLFLDVEKDIPWARIALEREPEAINLWIGNSRSITALHRDNYENIYCQVVGRKHFVLLSPMETACIDEADLQSATYMVYTP